MNEISGFGFKIRITASETFPSGFDFTQAADDGDPLDLASMTIRETAMGVNGDMVSWSKANAIPVKFSVVPGGDDDRDFSTLHEANRVGRGKQGARDVITVVVVYPNGDVWMASPGVITEGPPGNSIASAGRLKTNTYAFMFENLSKN